MSERDDLVYLGDMLDAITLVREYTSEMTREKFMRDVRTQDAVIRRIEVIGEAAKQIGSGIRGRYPNIPWSEAARMRDKLIHGYFGIDLAAVWKTVQEDLPAMGVELSRILEEESKQV